MTWHIVRREILDSLLSLRFSLTIILVACLMVLNGMVFREKYEDEMSDYSKNISSNLDDLSVKCKMGLNYLVCTGPGYLYGRPSPLEFCAEAGYLGSISAKADFSRTESVVGGGSYRWVGWPWCLDYGSYSPSPHELSSFLPSAPGLDWGIIVGVLMGFIAIIFTYDSISGEKESRTLGLVLSNQISRSEFLIGKILGSMIILLISVIPGMIINIMVFNPSNLSIGEWLRLLLIIVISLLYLLSFICLGVVVSGMMRDSVNSLIMLLLIWTIWIFILPQATGFMTSRLIARKEAKSSYVSKVEDKWFWKLRDRKTGELMDPSQSQYMMRKWGDYMKEFVEARQIDQDNSLKMRIRRAEIARRWMRLSPSSIYKYALEALAGTGLSGYKEFVKEARRYKEEFIRFLKEMDMRDPESPHVFWVMEGMSDKEVSFDDVPKFEHRRELGNALREGILDVGMLCTMAVLMFLLSYFAFMRADVR